MNGDETQTATEAPSPSPLANTNPEQAKATGWVVDKGDPDDWECVSKAHNDQTGEMKSTKRLRVPSGYIYQMTTKTPASVAECAVFVPSLPFTNDAPVTKPKATKPAAKAKKKGK